MSTDYIEPEDLTAREALLQVEQQADVIRALKQLYHTVGSEPLALVALRYGFGYDLQTIGFITGKGERAVRNTLQQGLHVLACHLTEQEKRNLIYNS